MDMPHTSTAMLRLDTSLLRLEPYPHLISDEMLEPGAFEALRKAFPDTSIFEANRRHTLAAGRASRINLGRGDPLFDRFLSECPVWRAFFEEMNSPAFIARVYELFGDALATHQSRLHAQPYQFYEHVTRPPTNLAYRALNRLGAIEAFDRLRAAFDSNKLCLDFDIAWARNGYATEAHTDNRNKLIAMLIYFGETGGSGGEFQVLKLKHPQPLSQCRRYPSDAELDVVTTLAAKPNRGLILLNCNNAYHAVTPLVGSDRPRQFMYLSVGSRYKAPIW
jgi:hypothetical protein